MNWGALDQIAYFLFIFPLGFVAFGLSALYSAQNGAGGWIMLVAGGPLFLAGLIRSFRRLQLTRYGSITVGRVVRREKANYERKGRTQYRNTISYFVDNVRHSASIVTDHADSLPPGAEVTVFYDVEKPSRHVMLFG